jgi:hypothetical protein
MRVGIVLLISLCIRRGLGDRCEKIFGSLAKYAKGAKKEPEEWPR